jgi:hypothetical protein
VRPSLHARLSQSSYKNSPRPVSASEVVPRLMSRGGPSALADDDTGMDAPSDTDVRIAELSAKIDKLTDLVL